MTTTDIRLWTERGFREDDWRRGEDAAALADAGRVILPLEAFLALDPELREREAERIGVELLPGEALDALLPYLPRLPLVALAFPAFNDGRSYSKAELLRTRHGYRGEIRATGDILIDQVAHMLRVGFSGLAVSNPHTLAQLEAGKEAGIPLYYQPAARAAAAPGSYAWRRLSA
ncbi:DUF934 domain-containing protein [Nitratireductor sp. ZSWI3]|uniref:DUF934 domain-containing protein n=1 Tax=Nitratireductor sp. ZSWI3 TaxID=2966359 RepID=UPI00214FB014|nr:DUF934 domain-containing protein [Nitratireductor sp. ZSWI3]MCR4268669.1 DUF934 domain-containing protein [Nitratireductor sp. ZSWI3]